MEDWNNAQEWEKDWWGKCVHTYQEEIKQVTYANRMGLFAFEDQGRYPVYSLDGKSIGDFGGGPISILLKCENYSRAVVVDPGQYPTWVTRRYEEYKISLKKFAAEVYVPMEVFDEIWIYNTLQHVQNPQQLILNAQKYSKIIRLFEWLEIPKSPGHLHVLHEEQMNLWLQGEGKTETMKENGCVGLAYYGVFLGNHYGKI